MFAIRGKPGEPIKTNAKTGEEIRPFSHKSVGPESDYNPKNMDKSDGTRSSYNMSS